MPDIGQRYAASFRNGRFVPVIHYPAESRPGEPDLIDTPFDRIADMHRAFSEPLFQEAHPPR